MAIHIQISGDTAAEAVKELLTLAYGITGSRTENKGAGTAEASGPIVEQNVAAAASTLSPDETTAVEATPAPKRTRAKKEAPASVAPKEEPAETQAQDKADEAAETEDKATVDLTLDSVKAAAGLYIKKFGLDFAQKDLMIVLKEATGTSTINTLPADDQAVLAKAVKAFEDAAEQNPYKRELVKAA
jgi:hypothetical protein